MFSKPLLKINVLVSGHQSLDSYMHEVCDVAEQSYWTSMRLHLRTLSLVEFILFRSSKGALEGSCSFALSIPRDFLGEVTFFPWSNRALNPSMVVAKSGLARAWSTHTPFLESVLRAPCVVI